MRNTTHPQPSTTKLPASSCTHTPKCPSADSPDREAAKIVAAQPEQGWSLLCNALLLWEDTGALLPDGQVVAPHRPTDSVGGALLLRFADTGTFIGGTTRSGKANMAALHAAMADLTGTSRPA
ncbi:DUF5999 family protein [Streptomyces sp. NPDC098077]|uniref:DUF5999 family protein n=1 Tax=Streptomyces sp. NPDC098077 TaxID=3366093 RepID=UPI003800490F